MTDLNIITKYTKADLNRLQPHLSNWIKAHAYIRQLDNSDDSLLELRKMISIELDAYGRVQMVTRLRSRYIAIRKHLEDRILFSKLKLTVPARKNNEPVA